MFNPELVSFSGISIACICILFLCLPFATVRSKRERKSIRQEAKSRNCQQHPNRQTCEETWNAESIELAEPLPPLP